MTRAEHREEQIRRVDAYNAWLRAGSPIGKMPDVPRNCDYKVWREAADRPTGQAIAGPAPGTLAA